MNNSYECAGCEFVLDEPHWHENPVVVLPQDDEDDDEDQGIADAMAEQWGKVASLSLPR